jgi:hypothetical protein
MTVRERVADKIEHSKAKNTITESFSSDKPLLAMFVIPMFFNVA